MCELDPDYSYTYDIDFESFSFRQLIRRSYYLGDAHMAKKHTTFQGKALEESVIHFDEMCNQNKYEFLEFCVTHKLQERKEFLPIFIFPEDKDNFYSIEKKNRNLN